MYENFKVVGLSHRAVPIEIRERLALSDQETIAFLGKIREILGLEDVLVLSTCNRTEIYYSDRDDKSASILSLLAVFKNTQTAEIEQYFKKREGEEAIRHLYEVSLGLDAKILGDLQIANQVKRAYQYSADEDMAGPFLHRLMHSVFYANKRVVQETSFRDGVASTSYASVDLAKQFILNFEKPRILVLGLGEIGRDVADNFRGIAANVVLANRTLSKSRHLAELNGFEFSTFEDAISDVDQFDVIISSIQAEEPILSARLFKGKRISHKLIIDLSVPRSVDPAVEDLNGVLLYNLDQLDERITGVLEKRKEASVKVRSILEESVSELQNWALEMEVSPTIKKLKSALELIRQEEMERYLRKSDIADRELVEKLTRNIIQKVIKLPVLQLKAACKRGDAHALVDVLNDLFDLEKDSQTSSKS